MGLMGILLGFLLYLEIVYHLGGFGLTAVNPVLAITFSLSAASLEALLVGCIRGKAKKIVFWLIMGIEYLWFAAEFVYLRIFKQPLLIEAAIRGGEDALTNYWREALAGILGALPFLLVMALPLPVIGILMGKKILRLPRFHSLSVLHSCLTGGIGLIVAVAAIFIGKYIEADFYEEYTEFFDPLSVAESLGVTTMVQRDIAMNLESLVGNIRTSLAGGGSDSSQSLENLAAEGGALGEPVVMEESGAAETVPETEEVPEEPEKVLDTSPQELPIDWAKLTAEASSKEETWLAEYMQNEVPTRRNEYTGLFEGYNLIFLTAEGFCPYAVREDLTPTLYRLIHSGFVFTNYYVPLWQTSTSDGEYVNLTGLIPDGQFSMRKTGENGNDMAFSLPKYFAREGVGSMAYHNNSMDYYDRHITHNNLGYIFKASKLGNLSEAEWGQYLFPLEHYSWPASDLEMMQSTMPEYVNRDRFHVYYMTVSGHMNYSFTGNSMSSKNRDAVAGLDMSENARAYIACNIELDKALAYMLEELEAAGQLEKTVICMSADHYPYEMSQEEMDELAGKSVAENRDLYRNNLILWNAGMEDEPVIVDKVCGAMDLMPTLLNLFGFEYDSRLFAGKDIFSEDEGMVIFNDRSFITDTVIYDRKTKETVWRADLEASGALTNDVAGYVSERGVAGIYADYEAAHGQTAGSGAVSGQTAGGGTASEQTAGGEAAGGNAEETSGIRHIAGSRREFATDEEKQQYFEERQLEVKNRYQFSAYILQKNYYHSIMGALPEEYQFTGDNPARSWEPVEPAQQETDESLPEIAG